MLNEITIFLSKPPVKFAGLPPATSFCPKMDSGASCCVGCGLVQSPYGGPEHEGPDNEEWDYAICTSCGMIYAHKEHEGIIVSRRLSEGEAEETSRTKDFKQLLADRQEILDQLWG